MTFLLSCVFFLLTSQAQPGAPIIVRIVEPEKSEFGQLRDVLIGSLGLTGVIILIAVVLGGLLAGVMFWIRSRSA